MKKPLEYLLAALCFAAMGAGTRVSAEPLTREDIRAHYRTSVRNSCPYVEYLHRPKQTGFVDELLGPIGEVKNGPYAAWTTKIAYLSVTGSMKFQSSPFVKDTWRLYPSTYDRYDFILGQEAQKFMSFRLSGDCSMTGIKLLSSDKVAHCYRVGLRPEAVLNRIRFCEDGLGKLTLSALAGPELGVMFSLDNWNLQARFYAGVTGAVRLDYEIAERFCLYFEPRLSYVPFTLHNLSGNTGAARSGNAFGSVTRLNLGLRISF